MLADLLFHYVHFSYFFKPQCKDPSGESRARSVQKFKNTMKLCIRIKMGGL